MIDAGDCECECGFTDVMLDPESKIGSDWINNRIGKTAGLLIYHELEGCQNFAERISERFPALTSVLVPKADVGGKN